MNRKVGLVCLLVLVAGASMGQSVRITRKYGTTETMNKVRPGMAISKQDRQYFAEARVATVFNLRAAEIAKRKKSSNWSSEFSEYRSMDYAQNYGELKVIGSKLGMKVDKSLPPAWERRLDDLRGKSGTAFENAYRVNYVKVNEQFAQKSEREVKYGNNSLIRNFAVTQGPVIRLNIKMAMRGVTKI